MPKKIVPTKPLLKKVAKDAPIDTTGMDPAMKATLTGERNRKGVMQKAFGPFGGGGKKPAAKPKKKS